MSAVEPGTVISGTMRDEDVIPALLAVLDTHAPERAIEIRGIYPNTIRELTAGNKAPGVTAVEMLRTDVWEAMEGIAPDGCYFGAHPGDGADFGFWESDDDD